jgi:hypothetical protein
MVLKVLILFLLLTHQKAAADPILITMAVMVVQAVLAQVLADLIPMAD